MKHLITANEAIARGAYEAGVKFAAAYPGTPSTEILENIGSLYREEIFSEWAPNEKVALEAAIGASIAGVRAISAMKHVGVNVAADPLFTVAYTGVTGGLVLVSADDPGMHSSQNEQDNRNYAVAARLLMLEPSDSQEALDFTKKAFELSERFDTPVLLRVTTRVCHSKGLVTFGERKEVPYIPYEKNIPKYVTTPANARALRGKLEERIARLRAYSEETELNYEEINGGEIGVVSAGVAYQYAREVFGPGASYFKVGLSWPMPIEKIRAFAAKVKKLYVVEEMDPYMENALRQAGIECVGKELVPVYDELNTDKLRKAIFGTESAGAATERKAVGRPPAMCAGCPHRGFFYVLSKKKNVMVTGDIGCYTLGAAPPLNALGTVICMGASISAGHGAARAFERAGADTRVVSVIGDSTFFHSGITSLMDVAYNGGKSVTVILDNRITGMTGHQDNPGTGYTLMGAPAPVVNIPALCMALGFKEENICTVDPRDLKATEAALDAALEKEEPSVIICKWPCALKRFSEADKRDFDLTPKKCRIDAAKCRNCRMCSKTGCPAIRVKEKPEIDRASCTGCSVCRQVCPFGAIEME